jgi:hypothetical protein
MGFRDRFNKIKCNGIIISKVEKEQCNENCRDIERGRQ